MYITSNPILGQNRAFSIIDSTTEEMSQCKIIPGSVLPVYGNQFLEFIPFSKESDGQNYTTRSVSYKGLNTFLRWVLFPFKENMEVYYLMCWVTEYYSFLEVITSKLYEGEEMPFIANIVIHLMICNFISVIMAFVAFLIFLQTNLCFDLIMQLYMNLSNSFICGVIVEQGAYFSTPMIILYYCVFCILIRLPIQLLLNYMETPSREEIEGLIYFNQQQQQMNRNARVPERSTSSVSQGSRNEGTRNRAAGSVGVTRNIEENVGERQREPVMLNTFDDMFRFVARVEYVMGNNDLRKWKYHKEFSQEKISCVICLECVNEGDDVCALQCNHIYHERCIREWLLKSSNMNCPICRSQTVQTSEENENRFLINRQLVFRNIPAQDTEPHPHQS